MVQDLTEKVDRLVSRLETQSSAAPLPAESAQNPPAGNETQSKMHLKTFQPEGTSKHQHRQSRRQVLPAAPGKVSAKAGADVCSVISLSQSCRQVLLQKAYEEKLATRSIFTTTISYNQLPWLPCSLVLQPPLAPLLPCQCYPSSFPPS